jgi:hypothetical protein
MTKNQASTYILFICLALGSLAILVLTPISYGGDISRDIAVRIIINEASNQGLKGMICVGEVLRHRGSIKGFRWHWAGSIRRSKALEDMAEKAWELSAHTNYTQGADHFLNIRRGGKPRWVRHCVKTYEYKDHVFYKEIRNK